MSNSNSTNSSGKLNYSTQPNRRATPPLRIAVLVSGNGSNLQALIDATASGELPIVIVGVISNNADAYALKRAEAADIATCVLSHTASGKRMGIRRFEQHALQKLNEWQVDLIVLAGFMRVLGGDFIDACPAAMINLHPSLLPDYKGLDTHARVLEAGDKLHGCSVHRVTADLDAGEVLTQAILQVASDDTPESLQARVHQLEHQLLPWTLALLSHGSLPLSPPTTTCPPPATLLPALPWKLCYF